MQEWLSNHLKNDISIADLICNDDDLDNYSPTSLTERMVHEAFLHARKLN